MSKAGADMLFPEALVTLDQYAAFRQVVKIPILANLTEFGVAPLFTLDQLRSVGVDIALYPLTISRVMNLAAEKALKEVRVQGTQQNLLENMLTRQELYEYLDYFKHEESQNGRSS